MSLNNRNIGIDLFKVFAMFLVVLLHVFWHGSRDMVAVWNAKTAMPTGATETTLFAVRALACCCVNCFALSTGYIYAKSAFKWHRIVVLWLQTAFWMLVCAFVFKVVGDYIGIHVSSRHFGDAFKPITCGPYWYFTAYAGLFVLMPFLNAAISGLETTVFRNRLVALLLVFCGLSTIAGKDVFSFNLGFSAWWLAVCYLIGAYVRIADIPKQLKVKWLVATIAVSWTASWILALLAFRHKHILLNYISVNILLTSVGLLVLFAKIKSGGRAVRFLASLAPYTFGIYLIHENPFVKEQLLNRFIWIRTLDPISAVAIALLIASAIFSLSAALDFLRAKLFAALKVGHLVEKAVGCIVRLGDRQK